MVLLIVVVAVLMVQATLVVLVLAMVMVRPGVWHDTPRVGIRGCETLAYRAGLCPPHKAGGMLWGLVGPAYSTPYYRAVARARSRDDRRKPPYRRSYALPTASAILNRGR